MNSEKGKIKSLQGLRALAFLGIFTSHTGLTQLGAWGVSVFFVLSGFLMAYVYYGRDLDYRLKSSVCFSIKKIKRLYLLHVLMLLAALLLELVPLFRHFSVRIMMLLLAKIGFNAVLLQDWVPTQAMYYSLNAVSWFLSACLLLYAAFPRILNRLRSLDNNKALNHNIYIYIYAGLVFALQIVFAYLVQQIPSLRLLGGDFGKWLTYICPLYRLGDFTIGCCFGFLFRKRGDHGKKSVATALEISAIVFAGASHFAFLKSNVQTPLTAQNWYALDVLYLPSSLLLVWVFARNRGWISRLLSTEFFVFLGDLSPYMFLIHQIVIRYLSIAWKHLIGMTMSASVCSILALILTIMLAIGWTRVYQFFSAKRITNKV